MTKYPRLVYLNPNPEVRKQPNVWELTASHMTQSMMLGTMWMSAWLTVLDNIVKITNEPKE